MDTTLDILHHSVAAYIALGWTHNTAIHFLFMVGVIVSWIINDNECIISKWQGKQNNEHSAEYFKKMGLNLEDEEVSFANALIFSYVTLLSLAKLTC